MKNWNNFSQAARNYTVPGQNIIYADKEGNIGWRPAVKVPIRNGGSTMGPLPGETSEYDWKGFDQIDKLVFLCKIVK